MKLLRWITSLGAAALSAVTLSAAGAADVVPQPVGQATDLHAGDVLAHHEAEGWMVVKILMIDTWPDHTITAHCLSYRPSPDKPSMGDLPKLQVLALHAPIAAESFRGWERIGRASVTKDDLAGFVEYLRLTDFRRYITFTGQDLKAVISEANGHYKQGLTLGDAGHRDEAIIEYTKAIDLFPLFYEAIDNRGFMYMELGRNAEALANFELSLHVNPDGDAAFFSRGECLMKLGRLAEAEAVFAEGQSRFPQQRALFSQFLEQVRAMRARSQ